MRELFITCHTSRFTFYFMIKFGTSGWRGIIARDFTFDNVRLATQGIADYLKSEIGNRKSAMMGSRWRRIRRRLPTGWRIISRCP